MDFDFNQNVWAIIIMIASIALLKQVTVCALPSQYYHLTP